MSAHGGRVAVEATPGGGATFVVELPSGPGNPPAEGSRSGEGEATDRGNQPPTKIPDIELAAGSAEATAAEAARR